MNCKYCGTNDYICEWGEGCNLCRHCGDTGRFGAMCGCKERPELNEDDPKYKKYTGYCKEHDMYISKWYHCRDCADECAMYCFESWAQYGLNRKYVYTAPKIDLKGCDGVKDYLDRKFDGERYAGTVEGFCNDIIAVRNGITIRK